MSAPTHKDPSKGWLILFFVCFIISVFGIGLWQMFTHYSPDAAEAPVAGGHGG